MKRVLLLAVLILAFQEAAFSQNCTQVLRLAQSIYENGRLHELPTLMTDCFQKTEGAGGFTQQQRVEAYRYLTLAYIYLEEPEKADETMLKLLQTDHFYKPNPLVDPQEFQALYTTFRTEPVFGIGAKLGVNASLPFLANNYYVGSAADGQGKYKFAIAFQAGLVFEKNFFSGWKSKFLKRVTFSPELFYFSRSFSYSNAKIFPADKGGASVMAIQPSTIASTWLELNPIFQYRLHPEEGGLNPYVGFGPGIAYNMSGSNTLVTSRVNNVGTVTGPAIKVGTYNKLLTSLIAVAGIKYQFGSVKLLAEARVQYGLTNLINPESRTNVPQVFDYGFTQSDMKSLNAVINIGFIYPYFNPIKKLHKR